MNKITLAIVLVVCLLIGGSVTATRFIPWGTSSGGGGAAPPAGPIMQLKLNDASGSTASDSSGNGNSGAITGTATWTTGQNSTGALSFDGSTNFLTIANESNFDFERTHAFSISMWVKLNSSATGVNGLFTKVATFGNNPGVDLRLDGTNLAVTVYITGTSGEFLHAASSSGSFSANVWHHVALTYDGTSTGAGCKLYLDGSFLIDCTGTGPLTSSILNTSSPFIGHSNVGGNFFFGIMDDARFYDRELSPSDVSTIFSANAQ